MLQLVVDGLALGCIYALLALSTILLLRLSGALTLAAGDLAVFLAYLAVTFAVILQPPLPLWAAALLTLLIGGLAGILIWWALLERLVRRPVLYAGLATVGVALALRSLIEQWWGPLPQTLPSAVPSLAVRLGTSEITFQDVFVIVVTAALFGGMALLFARSGRGRDWWNSLSTAAPPRLALAFAAASAVLVAIAALLYAPGFVQAEFGPLLLAKALAAILLGGFGNVRAAVIGAILLGLLEAALSSVAPVWAAQAIVLLTPLAVVWLLPGGVLGTRAPQRTAT